MLKIVKTFGDELGKTFGLNKCAKATFIRGRLKYNSSIVVNTDKKIKKLDREETYKYLGMEESDEIQHGKRKEKREGESKTRMLHTMLLQLELNAKNYISKCHQNISNSCSNIRFNWSLEKIKR